MNRCLPALALIVLGLACQSLNALTWYVRPDGGTRYSNNVPNGQCNGKADAPYPGSGVNRNCAFNDIRYLWTDGTYTVNVKAGAPKWGWIGAGGDTYILRGGPWRIGQKGPNSSDWFGMAGDPFSSGAPPPLSGTAMAHTRILGEHYALCKAPTARTQIFGGYAVGNVLNMSGASYVDVACLDISDHSNCGKAGQANQCNAGFPLSDFATNGIGWSNSSTNDTITDVRIHGMASAGMVGPTGTGMTFTDIALVGNASSGWNADPGDGTTGTGSLLVQNFDISWNGCVEEYPIAHPLPYTDCTDDQTNVGHGAGYGDGFGTATAVSHPAWGIRFDRGVVSYNTQDGLDALHVHGPGSSMTIANVLAYGNMGQQIKVGGARGSAINNRIVGNCNALRQAIPGTPAGYNSHLSDFCRAADTAVALTVGKDALLVYKSNTLFSANATGIEIDCDPTAGNCDRTSKIDFEKNIFIGFESSKATGYPNGGSGELPNPIYNGTVPFVNFFLNDGTVYSGNVTYHARQGWNCPARGEKTAICGDPHLVDESWHLYGYGNMDRTSASPVARAQQESSKFSSRTIMLGALPVGVLAAAAGFGLRRTPSAGR